MLGSHNSMSYLPAVKWWQRWQKRWYKCQEHTIEDQIKSGARYFDIRLKLIDGQWHFVHNKIDFGIEDESIYAMLSANKAYVRFIYDVRNKNGEHDTFGFLNHINEIEGRFPYIKIDSVITYWDWKEHYKPSMLVKELHSGVSSTILDYIIHGTKKCYALVNRFNIDENNQFLNNDENKVLLMDYI